MDVDPRDTETAATAVSFFLVHVPSRTTFFRQIAAPRSSGEIYPLHRTWTSYELLVQNCHAFEDAIADTSNLRTPLLTAPCPVYFLAELRALKYRYFSRSMPVAPPTRGWISATLSLQQ